MQKPLVLNIRGAEEDGADQDAGPKFPTESPEAL